MKRFLPLLLISFLFTGCAGVSQKIIHAEDGKSYKMEEVYSVGLFTPTWQYKKASECETVVEHVQPSQYAFGDGYDTKSVKNCKVIGAASDGFTADTTGPIGPALINGVSSIATGAIIADGIRDSNDTINNTNAQQQGQAQTQFQKQKQGQIQGQAQGQVGIVKGGGCRGNCGPR